MSKFKYNEEVLIIKDPENEGFFEGTKAIVKRYLPKHLDGHQYAVSVHGEEDLLWVKEGDIQKT